MIKTSINSAPNKSSKIINGINVIANPILKIYLIFLMKISKSKNTKADANSEMHQGLKNITMDSILNAIFF